MEIIIHDGKQEIMLRGGETCIEICEKRQRKGVEKWEARAFYNNPASALDAILKRRIRNSDARTLGELKEAIEKARRDILATYASEAHICACSGKCA